MSIVAEGAWGVLLDHASALTLTLQDIVYEPLPSLFAVTSPYFAADTCDDAEGEARATSPVSEPGRKPLEEHIGIVMRPHADDSSHSESEVQQVDSGSAMVPRFNTQLVDDDPAPTSSHPESLVSPVSQLPHQCKAKPAKRRRKTRHTGTALNDGEQDAVEYHQRVSSNISECFAACMSHPSTASHLQAIKARLGTVMMPFARIQLRLKERLTTVDLQQLCSDAATVTGDAAQLKRRDSAHVAHILLSELKLEGMASLAIDQPCQRLIVNDGDAAQITIAEDHFLIPSQASFLVSDLSHIYLLCASHQLAYDLIVMDPPWENKSVLRSGRYPCLPPHRLRELPVRQLAAPGALVVVWVTNKQRHHRFIRDVLFRDWEVDAIAEWHWVKICTTGEPVTAFDSVHRRPYETLIIGRRRSVREPPTSTHPSAKTLPEHQCIVNVPCLQHSRKPPLGCVLDAYLPPSAHKLELFARSLNAGWTSWGNECIKFQHVSYFKRAQKE